MNRRKFIKTIGAGLFVSSAGCISLLGDDGKVFSIGVVTDIQYADKDNKKTRNYRASVGKLETAVKYFNSQDLSFVIQLGDIVQGWPGDPAKAKKDMMRILGILGKLEAPIYHVVGNHCLSVDKADLRKELKLEKFNYDFTLPSVKGWRFVVLNGNDAGYGVYSTEQIKWLGAVLKKASEADEKVICFSHFPLMHESKGKYTESKNSKPVFEVIDNAECVVGWFAGHHHAGGYTMRKGVHHVTFQGMVETPDTSAYAKVEFNEASLDVTGFGRVPSRVLEI